MNTDDDDLQGSDPARWQIAENIILDWYDGEREGWCQLASPPVIFYYTLNDQECSPTFTLYHTPADALTRLHAVWDPHGPWPDAGTPTAAAAEAVIAELHVASQRIMGYAAGRTLSSLTDYWSAASTHEHL